MAEYINRDALLKELMLDPIGRMLIKRYNLDGFIKAQPTAEAVPVVRCKNCKHWQCDDSESYCDELGIFDTDMNSYCSYAKRKEK